MRLRRKAPTARRLAAAAVLCFCGLRAAAQEPSVSSATYPAPSPLFLTFSKDSKDSRVGLDYKVRWDFSDLRSLRPGLDLIYSGLKAAENWDITDNTRVDYYGFRTNPWRIILSKEKETVREPEKKGDGSIVIRPVTGYRKRLRLSFSPLVDELRRNFDQNLRDFLLKSAMSGAPGVSRGWERAGDRGRRAFVGDVLSLGIWDYNLPGLKQAGEGLEYLEGSSVTARTDRKR